MAGLVVFGHELLRLLHLLADEELTVQQIGEKYKLSSDMLFAIQSDNADKIEEIKKQKAGLYEGTGIPGLWIGSRENRIAEYQAIAETCRGSEDPKLIARLQTALRSVAEEMGDLKTNVSVDPMTVAYKVEGVDPKDLT